jgi:hypothetical protein
LVGGRKSSLQLMKLKGLPPKIRPTDWSRRHVDSSGSWLDLNPASVLLASLSEIEHGVSVPQVVIVVRSLLSPSSNLILHSLELALLVVESLLGQVQRVEEEILRISEVQCLKIVWLSILVG